MIDDPVVDGDDYFDGPGEDAGAVEPEANGDATPVGDIDSEADAIDDDEPADEGEGGEDDEPAEGEPEPEPVDEWLPGFEGRFRPGEEAKALEAYRSLEGEYSRRQNEFREQLEAERQAAFEQALQLAQAQQPQQSVVQRLQEQQQLTALALTNPGAAFKAALQTGDDSTIDAVIQAVASGDPDLGIDGDYSSALQMQGVVTQLQQQQREQHLSQQLQELRVQQALAPTAESFKHRYADVLQNEQVAGAFQDALATNWGLIGDAADSAQVNDALERSLAQALGQVALTHGFSAPEQAAQGGEPQAAQVQQRPAKRRPHVEGASATRAAEPRERKSESEQYADELLAAARHLKPAY